MKSSSIWNEKLSDQKGRVRNSLERSVNLVIFAKCRKRRTVSVECHSCDLRFYEKRSSGYSVTFFFHLLMWIVVFHCELCRTRCERQTAWPDPCLLHSARNSEIYADTKHLSSVVYNTNVIKFFFLLLKFIIFLATYNILFLQNMCCFFETSLLQKLLEAVLIFE
jgi:hypothetical protein